MEGDGNKRDRVGDDRETRERATREEEQDKKTLAEGRTRTFKDSATEALKPGQHMEPDRIPETRFLPTPHP